MEEEIQTFRSPSFSKELDVGDPDKADPKNGLALFNQDCASDIASLTSCKEGVIETMSSDVLKDHFHCYSEREQEIKELSEARDKSI